VQHAILQLTDRLHAFRGDALPQAPLERRVRVRAEIKTVVPEDAFQQQIDFDPFQLARVRRRRVGQGNPRHYLYSHTRMRESS
jgi:hypothetical protein